jgi:hypothetical protein
MEKPDGVEVGALKRATLYHCVDLGLRYTKWQILVTNR